MSPMIRILIADDHAIVRQGLRALLDSEPDMQVLADVPDGETALEAMARIPLDVAVVDMSMPGIDGAEVLARRRALSSSPHIIILTMFPEDHFAWHLLKHGAAGYLNKTRPPRELLDAIRSVARDGRYINPELEDLALERQLDATQPHESLTTREYQVFLAIVGGQNIKDIAKNIGLSASTVSSHVAALRTKLGARSIADIVHYAYRAGLI